MDYAEEMPTGLELDQQIQQPEYEHHGWSPGMDGDEIDGTPYDAVEDCEAISWLSRGEQALRVHERHVVRTIGVCADASGIETGGHGRRVTTRRRLDDGEALSARKPAQ